MTEYEEELLAIYNLLPRIKSLVERLLISGEMKPSEEEKAKKKKIIERRAELTMLLHNTGMCQMTKESLVAMYEAQEELKGIMRELND